LVGGGAWGGSREKLRNYSRKERVRYLVQFRVLRKKGMVKPSSHRWRERDADQSAEGDREKGLGRGVNLKHQLLIKFAQDHKNQTLQGAASTGAVQQGHIGENNADGIYDVRKKKKRDDVPATDYWNRSERQ